MIKTLGMIRRLLGALGRDRRGSLAVEVAMAAPVLATLLLSGVEVTRYVLLNQKLERASATMTDLVTQSRKLYAADLPDLFIAARDTVDPFDLAGKGRIIVSSIYKANSSTPARIIWQRGFGAGSGSSSFGAEGSDAVLPSDFIVRTSENVIVGEAFFDFVPVFGGDVIGSSTLHTTAILRPRFGPLTTLY